MYRSDLHGPYFQRKYFVRPGFCIVGRFSVICFGPKVVYRRAVTQKIRVVLELSAPSDDEKTLQGFFSITNIEKLS